MGEVELYEMFESSAKYQYFFAFTINLFSIQFGVTGGWASPSIVLLLSEESPLPSGQISVDEASWVVSLIFVGGLIGNLAFGLITARFGRKIPLLLTTIPIIISWLLVIYAQNIYYLYAARLLLGCVGGCIFIVIPLFLTEIATDRVRGTLGSTLILSENFGILLAFVLGHYTKYNTTPQVMIGMTIVCGLLLSLFPESPHFLMKRGKISEAEKSIRFYQNLGEKHSDYMIIQSEMNKLQRAFGDKKPNSGFKWSDLKVVPAPRAIIIGAIMGGISQFTGCYALLNYAASVFEDSGSHLSSNESAIIVGAITLIGSMVSTYFVDRTGRKFLFALSTIGATIGLSTLGIFVCLKLFNWNVQDHEWIPIVAFSFAIFSASLALLNLPYLIISEIMPENVKDFAVSFCMTILWCTIFIVVKYYPHITTTIGFPTTMFIFAGMCVLAEVFVIFFVPETKGKNHDEIMNSLREM